MRINLWRAKGRRTIKNGAVAAASNKRPFQTYANFKRCQHKGGEMKGLNFLLLFAIMFSTHVRAQDELISETFISPDKKFSISFKGPYRGEGAFFLKTKTGNVEILKRQVYYGPQVKWITENLAELRFGCGSPCWRTYYYDASLRKLSPQFDMVLAVNPREKLVAAIGEQGVAVSDMFSGTVLAVQKMDPAIWPGMLTFCDPEFRFVGNKEFRYSYKCGDSSFGPYAPGNGSQRIPINRQQSAQGRDTRKG